MIKPTDDTNPALRAGHEPAQDSVAVDLPADVIAVGRPRLADLTTVRVEYQGPAHDSQWWTAVWAGFLARYSLARTVVLAGDGGWHVIGVEPGITVGELLARCGALSPAALSSRTPVPDHGPGVIASIAAPRGGFGGARDIGVDVDGDAVVLVADSRRWRPGTVQRLARQLGHFAGQADRDEALPVTALDLLTDGDRRLVLADWNATDAAWPEGGYLDLIGEQVRVRPDACAIASGASTITFAEFGRLTNQIAHRLRRAGVADGDFVGLFCPRGSDYVTGAIGIMKAGAAIVALDPVNPDPRIAFMLADCSPKAVLTTGSLRDRLPGSATTIDIGDVLNEPADPVISQIGPDGISHLIYTSGSTGEPKAVLERRAAIDNLVHWTRRAYDARPGDRASWLSTPGFAVQIMEWMPYLALGVTVCIPELTEAQSPELIRDWLVKERVTHTMLVAALAEPAWSLRWPEDSALRIMVTTAERVHSWPPEGTPFRVVMTYGTTETTNALTCLDLGAGIDFTTEATPADVRASRQVPVGRPIANVRAFIVDERDRPVPPGVVGRLLISGAGLSAGYYRRADLTAAKFCPNPIAGQDGLVYATGDLARYRGDGAIELLGRDDAQVKIRGFRVELGEVEAAVAANPAVREAVVVAHRPSPRDVWLVAYVTTRDPGQDPSALRAELSAVLPYYMVPGVVVRLEKIPRLANGKADLRALPDPAGALRESQRAEFAVANTEIEVMMARLWSELFPGAVIGVHDNFFDLGGHSLLAFRLLAGVQQECGVDLGMTDLYEHPTAQELSELVMARHSGSGGFADLPAIEPDPSARFEPFPLTIGQQSQWIGRGNLVEWGGVGCHGYFEWESEDLDIGRFARAWRALVERHDALRTRFLRNGTQQVMTEVPAIGIPVADLRSASAETVARRLLEIRGELAHTVMAADAWPLFDIRLSLLPSLQGRRVRIHLALDFLVADAWSYYQVLVPDLCALYDSPDEELEPLDLTFRDYALAVTRRLPDSELYHRSRRYWMDRLPSLPSAPRLPERPAAQASLEVRFDRCSDLVSAADWGRFTALATRSGVTPSAALAAAYAEILRSWSREPSFCLNFPLFNRLPLHPQVPRLIGHTTTTLLLAVDGSGVTFADRAQALQKQLWTDLEHRHFSGVEVLRELTRLRGTLVPAMPVIMTSRVSYPAAEEQTPIGAAVYAISQTPQVTLDFQVSEAAGGLRYNWDFLPAVFPDGLIGEMFAAFRDLLARLTTAEGWATTRFGYGLYGGLSCTAKWLCDQVDASDTHAVQAWERYWNSVRSTGRGGDVLWDADSAAELRWCLEQAKRFMNPALPVVDLGCGNGRYSRALARHFSRVIGVDVSASAIEHARAESAGTANLSFAVLDGSSPEALAAAGAELGPVNVFVRAVLHVLDDAGRGGVASAISALVRDQGAVLIMEPDYARHSFGYVGCAHGRGRASELVRPLEAAGVSDSTRFATQELARYFPSSIWERLTSEAITMHVADPESDQAILEIPGFYAAIARHGTKRARLPAAGC